MKVIRDHNDAVTAISADWFVLIGGCFVRPSAIIKMCWEGDPAELTFYLSNGETAVYNDDNNADVGRLVYEAFVKGARVGTLSADNSGSLPLAGYPYHFDNE